MKTAEQRFWAKVDPCRTDGCALWLGGLCGGGYGQLTVGGKSIQAHYFLAGTPGEGLVWDHVKAWGCTHRNCVWPGHLEAVTQRVNVLRSSGPTAINAAKTHCKRGHPFDAANTSPRFCGARSFRGCRACARASAKRTYRKRQGLAA